MAAESTAAAGHWIEAWPPRPSVVTCQPVRPSLRVMSFFMIMPSSCMLVKCPSRRRNLGTSPGTPPEKAPLLLASLPLTGVGKHIRKRPPCDSPYSIDTSRGERRGPAEAPRRSLPMNFHLHRVPKMGFGLSVLFAFPCFRSRMARLIPACTAMTLLILFVCNPAARALDVDINHAPVEVYFSPNDGATTAIVREIDRARSEILVQALLLHLRSDRQGAPQGPQTRREGPGDPRQEPEDPEVLVGVLSDEFRHPDLHRRKARHCPQQDHPHRPGGRHHRLVQLHEGRRGKRTRRTS